MSTRGAAFETFVSVVVPLRNAAEHVEKTITEIDLVVRDTFRGYEIILVDDGSRDQTVEIIQRLQRQVKNIQLYCLHLQHGFNIALIVGIDNSIGDFVITLNVQSDPANLIPALWEKAQEGHELVCGVRTDSLRGGGIQSWINHLFQRAVGAMAGLIIPPGASDLRLYSRRVVNYLTQNNDRHLMLKVLPFFTSNRVGTVQYTPLSPRDGFGEGGLLNALTHGVSLLLGSSIRPLRLLTLTALLASSVGLFFAVYVVAVALFKRNVVEGWVSLALPIALMFFFLSMILGMLSEYIYILAQQSGNRPVYLVSRESTSSVLDVQQKLNVIEGDGKFSSTPAEESLRGDNASRDS